MARKQRRSIQLVLGEARRALGMSQEKFGYAVGASHRTAVRWDAAESHPSDDHLRKLAGLLHPHDRVLAAEVADFIDETLESLGLEEPAPSPAPAAAPSSTASLAPFVPRSVDLMDVVVLAAMEMTGSSSAEVRPLLHAVFKRAKDVGLTMDAAEEALRPVAAVTARKRASVQ